METTDRVQQKLAGWQGRLLFLGGSFTLINTVLIAVPTYFLSLFLLLSQIEKEIDALRRKFLWNVNFNDGKGFCLVNWKRVCKCKEFGSLGIINL